MTGSALEHAARGWPVFPVRRDKTPITEHGFKDAEVDTEQIDRWWAAHPSAGVGLATGKPSGLVVLDVDARKGGADSLHALELEHGPLPLTVAVSTGGGGQHHYFRHPGGHVPSTADKIGIGLDIRADGGYVVAPPSAHPSGRRYEWESPPDETDLADLPAWLRELTAAPPPRPPRAPRAGDDLDRLPSSHYVPELVGHEIGRGGKTHCPFHDDRTPSLQTYDDPDRGWMCFGCNRGGTIVDFGAALFALEPRGCSYLEIRRLLHRRLIGAAHEDPR